MLFFGNDIMELGRRARRIWQEFMVYRCCVEKKTPVAVHGRSSMMVACQMGVPVVCMMTRVNIASPAGVASLDAVVVADQVG